MREGHSVWHTHPLGCCCSDESSCKHDNSGHTLRRQPRGAKVQRVRICPDCTRDASHGGSNGQTADRFQRRKSVVRIDSILSLFAISLERQTFGEAKMLTKGRVWRSKKLSLRQIFLEKCFAALARLHAVNLLPIQGRVASLKSRRDDGYTLAPTSKRADLPPNSLRVHSMPGS